MPRTYKSRRTAWLILVDWKSCFRAPLSPLICRRFPETVLDAARRSWWLASFQRVMLYLLYERNEFSREGNKGPKVAQKRMLLFFSMSELDRLGHNYLVETEN